MIALSKCSNPRKVHPELKSLADAGIINNALMNYMAEMFDENQMKNIPKMSDPDQKAREEKAKSVSIMDPSSPVQKTPEGIIIPKSGGRSLVLQVSPPQVLANQINLLPEDLKVQKLTEEKERLSKKAQNVDLIRKEMEKQADAAHQKHEELSQEIKKMGKVQGNPPPGMSRKRTLKRILTNKLTILNEAINKISNLEFKLKKRINEIESQIEDLEAEGMSQGGQPSFNPDGGSPTPSIEIPPKKSLRSIHNPSSQSPIHGINPNAEEPDRANKLPEGRQMHTNEIHSEYKHRFDSKPTDAHKEDHTEDPHSLQDKYREHWHNNQKLPETGRSEGSKLDSGSSIKEMVHKEVQLIIRPLLIKEIVRLKNDIAHQYNQGDGDAVGGSKRTELKGIKREAEHRQGGPAEGKVIKVKAKSLTLTDGAEKLGPQEKHLKEQHPSEKALLQGLKEKDSKHGSFKVHIKTEGGASQHGEPLIKVYRNYSKEDGKYFLEKQEHTRGEEANSATPKGIQMYDQPLYLKHSRSDGKSDQSNQRARVTPSEEHAPKRRVIIIGKSGGSGEAEGGHQLHMDQRHVYGENNSQNNHEDLKANAIKSIFDGVDLSNRSQLARNKAPAYLRYRSPKQRKNSFGESLFGEEYEKKRRAEMEAYHSYF